MECPEAARSRTLDQDGGRRMCAATNDISYFQSHQEEDASDSDQDDDSTEDLFQQPRQSNTQSPLDTGSLQAGNNLVPNPTLAQIQNLLTAHPHILTKMKLENESEMLENTRNGLDALHRVFNEAALNNSNMSPFGSMPHFSFNPHSFLSQPQLHNNHAQLGSYSSVSGSRIVSPVNTRHSDSPMGSSPSGSSEVRETNNNNSSSNNNNNNNNNNNHHHHRESQNVRAECSNSVQNSVAGTSHQPGPSQQPGPSHPPGPSPLPGSNPQQTSWSFEDQFKQLYELSDDPQRKEFLDDLFSFMQSRGQPINRLPIMAKSVLDLYELYNLVIQRGGLVEVINKKLWQEIIKGLRLPSSITSAAFTLRTQYRKYLYDYECSKEHLSTPEELQVAIDGNRREGRRSSYSTYSGNGPSENSMPRSQHIANPLALAAPQITLPLIAAGGHQHHSMQLNGSSGHNPLSHIHLPPQGNPLSQGGNPIQSPLHGLAPSTDVMLEYFKLFNLPTKEDAGTPSPSMHRQNACIGNGSPGASSPPRDNNGSNAMEVIKSSWTLYNSMYAGRSRQLTSSPPRNQAPRSPVRVRSPIPRPRSPMRRQRSPLRRSRSPEPQALDLVRSPGRSPAIQSPPSLPGNTIMMGRHQQHMSGMPSHSSVARTQDEDNMPNNFITINCQSTRRNGAGSLSICATFGGIVYEGILLPRDGNESPSQRATPENTP
ncbi:protein dead ringer isoform X2 [Harpegnathos saltator]|uniref:protein dead ringer isoform X2 n=1 Tax=Harpegnathos saltator TaxID=610380 RepID=UPI00058C073D|nr:protein dead ringer isoform X2 [Harpegnathos saltator]